MSAAIQSRDLGKQYRIGEHLVGRYGRLTESLSAALRAPANLLRGRNRRRRAPAEYIWALRDVSFDVQEGEVMGVVGRNGAGKTTLLKLLSRITIPTEGSARLCGRIGSLLEVGTGFHGELTGRENTFLSGAILGMRRREIVRKFDDIVEFAELQTFIDTPVKRYSSGMYMRLAFAVAAHLEPDILIVDEVLAVGDAAFQRKCLGKMDEAAHEGRTVLFVSHNMQAMKALCDRAIYLDDGRVKLIDDARIVVNRYLEDVSTLTAERVWDDPATRPGDRHVQLVAVRVLDKNGRPTVSVSSSDVVSIETEWDVLEAGRSLSLGFDLVTDEGPTVFSSFHTDADDPIELANGHVTLRCELPRDLLNTGGFMVTPRVGLHGVQQLFRVDTPVHFDVIHDPIGGLSLSGLHRPGPISPRVRWEVVAS